jgi:hypothetical protein
MKYVTDPTSEEICFKRVILIILIIIIIIMIITIKIFSDKNIGLKKKSQFAYKTW